MQLKYGHHYRNIWTIGLLKLPHYEVANPDLPVRSKNPASLQFIHPLNLMQLQRTHEKNGITTFEILMNSIE